MCLKVLCFLMKEKKGEELCSTPLYGLLEAADHVLSKATSACPSHHVVGFTLISDYITYLELRSISSFGGFLAAIACFKATGKEEEAWSAVSFLDNELCTVVACFNCLNSGFVDELCHSCKVLINKCEFDRGVSTQLPRPRGSMGWQSPPPTNKRNFLNFLPTK